MNLHKLLATVVASTLVAGVTSTTALAASAPSPAGAGTLQAWGATDASTAEVTDVPEIADPVTKVATNMRAGAAVTVNGELHVWGNPAAPEVALAPDEGPERVTDAVSVALVMGAGAVLHADGQVSVWGGNAAFGDVPDGLRAKAIAITPGGTGYAVRTDGTLEVWGTVNPMVPTPAGLRNLVDVSAGSAQVLALHANGMVTPWGFENEVMTEYNSHPRLFGNKVTQIATGGYANGLVLEDGSIRVWGFQTPAGPPDLTGENVVSLDLNGTAGAVAVTDEGDVHAWGSSADIKAVPEDLAKPISSAVVGSKHVIAINTVFRDLTKPTITGESQAGKTLTATPATFSLVPGTAATGQWFAGTTAIAGQTGTTLTLTDALVGKKISYVSTATRGTETLTSASAEVGPVTAVAKAPVVKANSKTKVNVKVTGKTKKVAKKVKVAVKVTTAKGVSPAGKVTVVLKGKSKKKITANVNAQGKATVTLKKVKRGKYTVSVKYSGNTLVNGSKAKRKFKA